ncbi:protein phosphatase 2C domain-containing protein [Paenibacillus lignilyticus]|uniref:Protein phosphatase 2C domain-containing protein n=1 Tax=Paenibacillus lignilyticus TaxID=1172615 RepID=A0ABS5CAL7_9BACL|nr:protein phosphatase 2C domain-containing protein [Paenibacillus lignilyticus]MBP3963032.1 protein phosphatase 2C domain-containing protein [Paenibacillus lignilyticus]
MPKAGNRSDEYEDASHSSTHVHKETTICRFAIADGASESSYAELWANLLVSGYCFGRFGGMQIHKSVFPLSKAWQKKTNGKNLPWYAQEKLSSGAFSTLAGITFRIARDAESAAFDAMAVGDSCIFHVRGDSMLASFPLSNVDEFLRRPVLISSNTANNAQLKAFVHSWSGTAEAGDEFWLMTDALACWLLTRYKEDRSVIWLIHKLGGERDFNHLVHEERRRTHREGRFYLRNDDVTFIRLKLVKGK